MFGASYRKHALYYNDPPRSFQVPHQKLIQISNNKNMNNNNKQR